MFIDEAIISVRAGKGGNGAVSFRREKFVPKGGPDGGNGGNGGNVTIRADSHLTTLMDFRYKRKYQAEDGVAGMGSRKSGKRGRSIVLRVPCGTILKAHNSDEVLADLINNHDEIIIAKGGRGGKGNSEFATSTNQAPRTAERGERGEELIIDLELRLLADVGLVGLPNAGKSTLISRISAARPKIADYPFTTLIPNLGIVYYGEEKSFVVADMPGLIEGAHRGRGLGIQFLRHIERTRLLALLIDCTTDDPLKLYDVLLNELEQFDPALLDRPRIVVLTKTDLLESSQKKKLMKITFGRKVTVHRISAVSGDGLKKLVDEMWELLDR